jgi:alpha-amylase
MRVGKLPVVCILFLCGACQGPAPLEMAAPPPIDISAPVSDFWKSATVYFLLTDRFYNGDSNNDFPFGRTDQAAPLRHFMGGDLKGVALKIEEGYFDSLGVDVLWLTPLVEQVRGKVDEGDGLTYAYHGYWTRDWTALDPNFGTENELRAMIDAAHQRGIRVLMDVVLNHTGPVTDIDSQWPDEWVRTGPRCEYTDFRSTVECTLVDNLPDIRTERSEPVELPDFLREKWALEGRLEKELAELDAFFQRSALPRTPHNYIIKWLTDWVRRFGVDGFRGDTAKHIEPEIWADLKREAILALREWKRANPDKKIDDEDFFMVGEVYGFALEGGRLYDFGDRQVDFFDVGFESLINFGFKTAAQSPPAALFSRYDELLREERMRDVTVLHYLSSHDDGAPFDRERRRALEAGTKLLLAPGAAQIYYGDESARLLQVPGARGDAHLRSFMNWEDLEGVSSSSSNAREVLAHWRKLGRFRRAHSAVGAGVHEELQASPLLFSRRLDSNGHIEQVLIGLDLPAGRKSISVFDRFPAGATLKDHYSGMRSAVDEQGMATFDTPYDILLLAEEQ